MPNGHRGQPRPSGSRRQQGGGAPIKFEIPRRAVPDYLTALLGDYHTLQSREHWKNVPPGHRVQLYFHGMADKGEIDRPDDRGLRKKLEEAKEHGDWETLKRHTPRTTETWVPLKNQKRVALQAAAGMGGTASAFLSALAARAASLGDLDHYWRREAVLIAPLATGLGNPHPVENGFAFLSPYGVPYLAGSGVKGVIRRATEELALIEPGTGWTLAHVWALFGFDENSAVFPRGNERETHSIWCDAYAAWIEELRAKDSPVLNAWLEAITKQLPQDARRLLPPDLLWKLSRSQSLRRAIHWQGMLAFYDAFPDEGANMIVDILNPHHKNYYEGKGTPHDAENPVPVFFLTVTPGARFTFRAGALLGRDSLWQAVGDWRSPLDAAFDRARDQLGFGAKTAVGYGAMVNRAEAGTELQTPAPAEERPKHLPAPGRSRNDSTGTIWERARLKFNANNGTLTAIGPNNVEANALAPRGLELLASLPAEVQRMVRANQFVRVVAKVRGTELIAVETRRPA